MDAASAAAMSDPDLNTHFRRRWNQVQLDAPARISRPANSALGTLGIALQEALRQATGPTTDARLRKPPEGLTDG